MQSPPTFDLISEEVTRQGDGLELSKQDQEELGISLPQSHQGEIRPKSGSTQIGTGRWMENPKEARSASIQPLFRVQRYQFSPHVSRLA